MTWGIPAIVFLWSGALKLIAPDGTGPQMIAEWEVPLSYATMLRLLGAIELGLALLLLRPSTRIIGRALTSALLIGFTLLVATNAADSAFVQDCGCLGPLDAVGGSSHEARLNWMIGRNCVLLAFAMAHLIPGRRWFWVALFTWVVAQWQSEAAMREFQRDLLFAADRGNQHARSLGWQLPDLKLQVADVAPSAEDASLPSSKISSPTELQAGDHLIFFSPTCEHCLTMRNAWIRHAAQLREQNARLVLLVVSDADQLNDFRADLDFDGIPIFIIRDRLNYASCGIIKLPSMLILGDDRQVIFNNTLNWRPPAMTALPNQHYLLRGGPNPAYALEVEIVTDKHGVIQSLTPTHAGDYARQVWPNQPGLQVLVGKTLPQAFEIARQMSGQPVMEAPIWAALTDAMADHR